MNKIVTLEPGYNLRDVKQHTVIGSTADLQNKTIKLLENSQEVLNVDNKRFNAVQVQVEKQIYLVAQKAICERGLLRSSIEAFNENEEVIIDQKFIQRDIEGNSLTAKIPSGSFVESGVELAGVKFKSCKVKEAQNDVYVNEAALWKSINLKDGFRIRDINSLSSFDVTHDELTYGILKSYKRYVKKVDDKKLPFYKVLVIFEDGTQKKAFISVNALTNAPLQNNVNQPTFTQVASSTVSSKAQKVGTSSTRLIGTEPVLGANAKNSTNNGSGVKVPKVSSRSALNSSTGGSGNTGKISNRIVAQTTQLSNSSSNITVEDFMAETDSSKKIRTFLDNKLDDFLGFAKVDQNSKDVELLKRLGRVYQSLVFKGKALQLAFKFANTHANHSDKWVVFNVALLYTKLINKNVDAKSDALKFLARFALQSFAKGFNARELAVVIKLVELYQKLLWNNFADAYQPALEFANAHGQSTNQFNITESLSELYRLLLEKDVAGSKKAALEFAKRYSSRDEISIKTKLFELYKKLIDDGFTNAYKPAEKYLQSNEKEEKLKADCIEIYTQLVSKGSISAYKPALKFARSIRERNDFDDLFNLYMAFIDKNVKEAYKPALEFAKLSNDTRHKVSLYVALIKKGVQGADAPAKTLLTEWGDYLEQALPAAYEFLIDKFPSVRSGGVNGKAVSNNGQANTTPTPPSSRQFEVNPQGNSVTINNKEYTVNTDGVLDLSSLKKISAAEIEVLGEMKNLRKLYLNGLTTLGVLQARALGEMKKLYELRLTGVPSLSDEEKMRLDGSASLKVYAWKQATIVLR